MERPFKAATKLRRELPTDIEMESIPLMELSSLVEDIHVKKWEASQNTDLDMRESLGIDKVLRSIQGELLNNTSKSTVINKSIKRDTKKLGKLKMILLILMKKGSYTRCKDGLDNLNTEKQAWLEILSQNRKDL